MQEMHKDLIAKWNKQVKNKDIVYVLGDVTFGKWEESKEIVSRLNGRKILIRGNHDDRFTSAQWIELGFEDVRDILVIKKSGDFPVAKRWILCHYPYSSSIRYFFYRWFGRFFGQRSEAGYYKLFLSYKDHKLVHGHHHDGPIYKHDQLNVAWDIHGRLLNENDVLYLFETYEKQNNILSKLKTILW